MGPCHIHAIGVMKKGPLLDLWNIYQARLQPSVTLKEYGPKSDLHESNVILGSLKPRHTLIALDERGDVLSTMDLYTLLSRLHMKGHIPCFAIGGADGHHETLRQRADYSLSFGHLTWPHMLARVMLIEQIYRVQQIHIGHPYHREG